MSDDKSHTTTKNDESPPLPIPIGHKPTLRASTQCRRGTRKYEISQVVLTFLLCQLVGSMFYFVCALKYSSYPRVMGTIVTTVAQLVNYAMIVFPTFRIVAFLAVPSLLTGRLRALLLVIIFTWSIQFAAMNVTTNIRTTAEGIVCVQERVRILGEELKESADKNLRQVPVQKIQRYLQGSADSFGKLRETLRNMDESLSNMMAWQRSWIMKMKTLLENCSQYALIPFHACVGSLTELHAGCVDSIHEYVCAPINLLKNLCYVSKILELQCEWPKMMKNQMEEGVGFFVKESKQKAMDYARETMFYDIYVKAKGAKQSYETLEIMVNHSFTTEQRVELRSKEFQIELLNEVGYIEKFIHFVIFVSNVVFIVVLILPFLSAAIYMYKFNHKDDANNYFLSDDLAELNAQQLAKNLPVLLPLTDEERKMYISWIHWRIVPKECTGLLLSLALTLLAAPIPVTFVASDIFMYKALDLGYEFFHSNDTRLERPNIYNLKVSGDGFMSELLSNLLNTFEPLNRDNVDRDSMWHECFSEPNPPDYQLFKFMLAMYIVCIVLCFLQVYVKRAQHKIALFYFPERRLPRAVHLYNSILEARYAKKLADEDRDDPLDDEALMEDFSLSISHSSESLDSKV